LLLSLVFLRSDYEYNLVDKNNSLEADAAMAPKFSRLSIWALICGIFSIFVFPAILGVFLGGVALFKISKSRGQLKGKGMAITGMVLSVLIIVIIPVLVAPELMKTKDKAKLMTELSEVRMFNIQMMLLNEPLQTPTDVIHGSYTEGDYRALLTVDHLEASGNWIFYMGLSASSSPGMSPVVISPVLGESRIVSYLNSSVRFFLWHKPRLLLTAKLVRR